jgi:phenylacetic acid degradation operon negative regulatory protein
MPNIGPVRPQSLMLTLLGRYVLGREVAVFSGSYVAALERTGVSEHATRSTLTRMARRGLLERHRRGRRAYYALSAHSITILEEGRVRIGQGVDRAWDGTWTLLGFSLPQSWRRQRHTLRSRLQWAGFGCLQSGLWVAPSSVDVPALIGDLGLLPHVRVFFAQVGDPTRDGQLVEEAFDLAELASRYRAFLERWDGGTDPCPADPDPFAELLLLATEWLLLVRQDPRLPLDLLPPDWPARSAESVYRRRERSLRLPADAVAAELLETVPL